MGVKVRRLFTHHGIERLADLRRGGSIPARADLAHIDEILAFPLAQIQRGDAGILDEADHLKLALLNDLDLLPGFDPVRSVWRIHALGDDALIVQLAGSDEQRLAEGAKVSYEIVSDRGKQSAGNLRIG